MNQNLISNPVVSVVIPAYKAAKYIEGTIESVLSQEGVDFELIVADQESGDGTWEKMQVYAADPRVQLYQNTEGGAAKGNWTFVTNKARGKYIKLLPSDDKLLPGILKRQVDLLEETGAVLTACYRQVVDGNGKIMSKKWGLRGITHPSPGLTAIKASLVRGGNSFGEPGGVTMIRETLTEVGGWNFAHPYVVDLETYCAVLEKGEFVPDLTVGVEFRAQNEQWSVTLKNQQEAHTNHLIDKYHRNFPQLMTAYATFRGKLLSKAMQSARQLVYVLKKS